MAKNENRCWPGYEPVPGKTQHEEGSCRKKADSKLAPSEKTFRAKHERELKAARKKPAKKAASKAKS